MIKLEFDTLVLDSTHSKSDQDAINEFINNQIMAERHRIYDQLTGENDYSHVNMAKFKVKQIVFNRKEIS